MLEFKRATAEGLMRAAIFLYNKCRAAVNKSNTDRARVKYKRPRKDGAKSRTVYANMHNAYKGQPPRKRTGFGQSCIAWESNGSLQDPRVRVGVTKAGAYMIYLELGTKRIKARPWLRVMLKRYEKEIGRLAMSGFRDRKRGK